VRRAITSEEETLMVNDGTVSTAAYEAPALVEIGALQELTLGCDKTYGSSDGFTFMGQAIVCTSA
jgi:hypothetical protein